MSARDLIQALDRARHQQREHSLLYAMRLIVAAIDLKLTRMSARSVDRAIERDDLVELQRAIAALRRGQRRLRRGAR